MVKLLNNRIVTLIEAILLMAFGILTLVIGDKILAILIGIALLVYVSLVVIPKLISYNGVIKIIAIMEFFAVTFLAVLLLINKMDLFYNGNAINLSLGAAMWFRGTTEILHSYHGQGEGREQIKKFNAWVIFCYILLLTFGTFFAFTEVLSPSRLQVIVACIAFAAMVVMIILTVSNFVEWYKLHPRPPKPKKEKPEKAESEADERKSDKKKSSKKDDEVVVLEEVVETPEIVPVSDDEKGSAVVEYIAPKKK